MGKPELLSGWLLKKGEDKLGKGRHFNLDQDTLQLHYYKNAKSSDSQGYIDLRQILSVVDKQDKKSNTEFQLVTKSRIWNLKVDPKDLDKKKWWISTFNDWIAYLKDSKKDEDSPEKKKEEMQTKDMSQEKEQSKKEETKVVQKKQESSSSSSDSSNSSSASSQPTVEATVDPQKEAKKEEPKKEETKKEPKKEETKKEPKKEETKKEPKKEVTKKEPKKEETKKESKKEETKKEAKQEETKKDSKKKESKKESKTEGKKDIKNQEASEEEDSNELDPEEAKQIQKDNQKISDLMKEYNLEEWWVKKKAAKCGTSVLGFLTVYDSFEKGASFEYIYVFQTDIHKIDDKKVLRAIQRKTPSYVPNKYESDSEEEEDDEHPKLAHTTLKTLKGWLMIDKKKYFFAQEGQFLKWYPDHKLDPKKIVGSFNLSNIVQVEQVEGNKFLVEYSTKTDTVKQTFNCIPDHENAAYWTKLLLQWKDHLNPKKAVKGNAAPPPMEGSSKEKKKEEAKKDTPTEPNSQPRTTTRSRGTKLVTLTGEEKGKLVLQPPPMEGWLEKRGEKNRAYKRRWFEQTGTKLYYSEAQNGRVLGYIDMTLIKKVSGEFPGRKFAIETNQDNRTYHFQCTDAAWGHKTPEETAQEYWAEGFSLNKAFYEQETRRGTFIPATGKVSKGVDRSILIVGSTDKIPPKPEEELEGYLHKQGEDVKASKKRFFKQEDDHLAYYKKWGENQLGYISLSEISKIEPSGKGKFLLHTPDRIWKLKVTDEKDSQEESPKDLQYWVEGIIKWAQYYQSSATDSGKKYVLNDKAPKLISGWGIIKGKPHWFQQANPQVNRLSYFKSKETTKEAGFVQLDGVQKVTPKGNEFEITVAPKPLVVGIIKDDPDKSTKMNYWIDALNDWMYFFAHPEEFEDKPPEGEKKDEEPAPVIEVDSDQENQIPNINQPSSSSGSETTESQRRKQKTESAESSEKPSPQEEKQGPSPKQQAEANSPEKKKGGCCTIF